MPRRDDDIFRKLKNQKPLAKSVGEQKDFSRDGKNTFDLMVEKKTTNKKKPVGTRGTYYTPKKRGDRTVAVSKSSQKQSLDIFSSKSPDNQKSKAERRSIVDERTFSREKAKPLQRKVPEKLKFDEDEATRYERKPLPKRAVQEPNERLIFDENKNAEPVREKAQFEPQKRQQSEPILTRQPISRPPVRAPQPTRAVANKADYAQKEQKGAQQSIRKVFRHELKYYINYKDYYLLRASVGAVMRLDENANENRSYHIRSLYFDDIYERALAEKVAGNDDRCKYRIRIYDFSDGMIKLEKKQKHGHYIQKTSMSISREEYECLIAGNCDFLMARSGALAKEVYLKMKTELLRPRVIVDYTREAYVHPIEDVRVTFDMNLKGSTMMSDIFTQNIPCMPMYENGTMVMEVKFNKFLPESIKCALSSAKAMQRSAISKYVLCRKFD